MGFRVDIANPDEIGREQWDAYVGGHPEATPYHRLGWLQAISRAYGHRCFGLRVLADDATLVGVLPLCLVKTPLGGAELTSLPYCDLGGPLAENDNIAALLSEAAVTLAREHRVPAIEFRLTGERADDAAVQGKVSLLLSLPESAEALFKSYKPKLRSQIRKAEKNGLTAELSVNPQDIQPFYQVFADNMRRLGSPVHSARWFRELRSAYGENMLMALVRHEGTVVGAGIVLLNGHRASIPWASTIQAYNHLAPNMLLYWSILEYVANHGYTVFDFGRSTAGEGTYRFKRQWGAMPWLLNWVKLDTVTAPDAMPGGSPRQPGPVSDGRARQWAEALWRRLPLWLANRLGPLIRKYVTL
ncbi:MAG TPA: FemAB family XrtA/PEP-CTERM system-associated protein [Marinobacter sp.]|uniref:FemAB family XrtA/PEP-CTERM system-associated protein n=1 Tax=Marinobacter sp. TaxID=50741 RepID=UPI002D802F9F|nr:FemAB family XrtA/PEP-CTERM system-associated protein [Marinobacter sp.]HET8800085.1 FemAB family XrtA/PEP-CTERM system-associated protein [Marinobacter sp.]